MSIENNNWVLGCLTLRSQEEKLRSAKKTGKDEGRKKLKRKWCSGSLIRMFLKKLGVICVECC